MVLDTNSKNQQVGTNSPVYYEELKGSVHEELEQKRKLKFETKVQVQDISLTGKKGRCEKAKVDRQRKRANAEQININKKSQEAFKNRDLETAKFLIDHIDLNSLYECKVQGRNGVQHMPVLLRHFVNNACTHTNWFKFYQDILSEKGEKINIDAIVTSDGGTALSYACRKGNRDVTELLLNHGADVNKVSAFSGETPILIALKNNDHSLANLLFQHGAKIDVSLKLEEVIAANSCNQSSKYTKETMKILLQYTSPRQNTLMLMCFSNNETSTDEDIEIVKLLLEKGADLTVKNTDGKTSKDIATEKGNTELIGLFNQKLGIEPNSLENSFVIIPEDLTLSKIQDILNKATDENNDAKLTEVINNIQDYESQFICNFDDPEEAGLFMEFSKKVLKLQSQVRDQYVLSRILMVLQPQENGSRYSVKELLLLAIAANDELTEKHKDMLFARGNLSLLPLLVGNQKYIDIFTEKFPDLYQSLKNLTIQLEDGKIGFFSVIALREEQELLDKVFANEDTLQNLKEILKNNTSDPMYGVLEAASLVQNEEFIKKVLDVFERDAKQNINDPATKTLLKESCIALLEAAISQERLPIVEYLCKKCIEDKNEAIQTIYKEAFADDKVIETLREQILRSIGARSRRKIYDLMLKTASSADNIVFLRKVLNLVKGNTKLFRESFATISENASPTTVEQLQKYVDGIKDMTEFTEVPRGVEPREEIQKALEKCLESRILHKYSEFKQFESRYTRASSNGWFAKREGVEFFIKPLNVENDDSVRSFITEVIAGPLYRLALFGKSPKIWLIKDDQDKVFLGSEFLPNFNTFLHLYGKARDTSKIKQNYLEEQAQRKFKEELQKSVENSKYFAKFLAACLIFREFDFNLGNFGIVETNDTGVTERKWAKIDHGLSFEYQRFDQECSSSDCLGILKFYLQERKQHRNPVVDDLLKGVLAELVDGGKLLEELGNMCKFLEESKALIEQLIDKQVGDLNKALSAHHGIKFSILNETFSYNAKRRVFVTDQGDELSKYFKEILYDQVEKAKEFPKELSKKNKDLKEELSLGCNSLDNTTGSNAQGDSSKAHSKVIVTESNGSDGENKKTVASSIRFQGHTSQDRKENLDITGQNVLQLEQEEPSQQAKTDDLIQEKNQLGKEPNSAQKSSDGKIAELQDRKTFAKEEKNDTLNRIGSSIQNFISYNSREGKMPTNTEQQVKSSLGQEKSENTRNQLEKLQKELNEKTQALESTKTQLAEKEEELKGVQVQLEQEKTKLQDELKKKEKELNSKTRKVTELTEEKSQLEEERNSIQQDLVKQTKALNSTQAQLEKLQKDSDAKTKEFEGTKAQLERERDSVKQELDKTTEELKRKEADLKNGKKELDNMNEKVSKLEHETLNQQASIDDTNQALDTKTSEVTNLTEQLKNTKAQAGEEINKLNGQIDQLTAENTQLKDNLKTTTEKNTKLQSNFDAIKNTLKTTTEEDTKLQNDLEVTRKIVNEKDSQIGNLNSNIIELNEQLRNKDSHIEGLNDQLKSNDVRVKELNNKLESKSKELNNTHRQLENKSKLENQIKELSCKNQKLSKASTHSKRQSNYASVSFVLSGLFAVGASLTMFHLVICISLAVAALTFLAVGCYCLYRVNTVLSNVEVDNCVNPAVVEVLNSPS